MVRGSPTVEELLNALAESPRLITRFTVGLSESRLRPSPAKGEWSVCEIFAHLRSCADVWGGAMTTIVRQDYPTIRAINPRTWIESTDYRRIEFGLSLRAFARQRLALMKLLRPLSPQDWSRAAHITGAGAPLDWTLEYYAIRLSRHERLHVQQIRSIAAALRPRT